jgi:hypothetical protein
MLKVSLPARDSKPGEIIRQYVDFEFYNYSLSTSLEYHGRLYFIKPAGMSQHSPTKLARASAEFPLEPF